MPALLEARADFYILSESRQDRPAFGSHASGDDHSHCRVQSLGLATMTSIADPIEKRLDSRPDGRMLR